MVLGTGACVDCSGEDHRLGTHARLLIDEGDVEILVFEVTELLGQHVGQVDLLAEPTDHDLHGVGRGRAGLARSIAAARGHRHQHRGRKPDGFLPSVNVQLSIPPQMVTSLTAFGRHLTSRFSIAVTTASATSATVARITMAAKTPLAVKVFWATTIINPTPLIAPRYSPTTAPTRANPKLTWRLAMIQLRAEGMITSVVMRRSSAPRMRALASRFLSTSRTPWKALKKTMKKTSTTASATFDCMPRPKAMTKIAPRTTRGIELAALM